MAQIKGSRGNQTQITQWSNLSNSCDELEMKVDHLNFSITWLEDTTNHDVFDDVFVANINSNIDRLKQQIAQTQQLFRDTKREFNRLDGLIHDANSQMQFLKMCDELHIKPWHYKNDSMIGPSVKKFVYNFEIAIKYLDKSNSDCSHIATPLLARLRFIMKVIWTKDREFFDKKLLRYLKWNLLEFDFLYHKFVKKYGGGGGKRLGVKWHGFYHSLEWCNLFKFAPAFVDEQRVEAFNLYIANFLPIYTCFGGHINLDKMMNKLWRRFVLVYNASNKNKVWNGSKMV
jgi:hypothetical protein